MIIYVIHSCKVEEGVWFNPMTKILVGLEVPTYEHERQPLITYEQKDNYNKVKCYITFHDYDNLL